MNRRFLLESLLESKPQLATPTISLSDSILSIEEVENEEYYDIYVDGVLEESVPAVSGYQVTVTNSIQGTTGHLYDGQDNTGIDLGTMSEGEIKTFHIESGYIYIDQRGVHFSEFGGSFLSGNPFEISSDVSLHITNSGGSN